MSEWINTQLGKIPSQWSIGTLGEISSIITDGSHISPKPIESKNYMASVKDMRYNKFDFSKCKTISDNDFERLLQNNCSPKPGDILLSKDGANCLDLIFEYRQKNQIVLLSSIAIARLNDGFHPTFYRYLLLSPNVQSFMRNNMISGSAIPRVVLKDFRSVPVLILDLKEQKAIASVLSSLDDKIDLLHRQNQTLEAMAQTLFRQWFVKGEETQIHQLGQLVDSVSIKHGFENKKVIFLNTSDVFDGKVLHHQYTDVSSLPGQAKKSIQNGDILFTEIRPANRRFAYINFDAKDYVVSTKLMVLRSKNKLDTSILYSYLKMPQTLEYLQMLAEGRSGTFPQITFDHLKSIEVYVPKDKERLVAISSCLRAIIDKTFQNHSSISSLVKIRDTLLPKLMSGEVRVDMK